MPFGYALRGADSLARAEAAIAAATAEAEKRLGGECSGGRLRGQLVAFARMDGAQLGSIAISEHKARTAVKSAVRPRHSRGIRKRLQYQLTLDDVIASRGGIPLIEDGKLIGAIGCSAQRGRRTRRLA